MTEIRKRNSVGSGKLEFLDNIYVEHDREGYVKIGLKQDVMHQHGNVLTHFRYFKVNPRRD